MDQRRTLDEVNALYDLEPEVCDVYVEGNSDKCFVDWYLRKKGYRNVTVYPIEVIEIPEDVVTRNHLPTGSNRSRVIALSHELTKQHATKKRVMCIIDRDSDELAGGASVNPYLFTTDGNSLELYALAPEVIEKFLLVALAGFPIAADSLVRKLIEILERVYVIRQANEKMRLGMEWISLSGYIHFAGNQASFRELEFVRAYLQKNNQWQQREAFEAALESTRLALSGQATRRVRGHDLSELLHVIVRKFRKDRAFANPTALEGCLMASIESRDLESYPLFQALELHAAPV